MRTFFLLYVVPCNALCKSDGAMLPDGAMLLTQRCCLRSDVAYAAMLLSQRCVPSARYVQNTLRH